MAKIKTISAREILDSRGFPTVEVDALLSDGSFGRAAVPSGASTGEHEALELRDGDAKRFLGKGVLKAVNNVSTLFKAVKGMDADDLEAVDAKMVRLDGTPAKSKFGANAILGVSMAVSRAAAASAGKPLYQHLRKTYGIKDKEYVLPAPMMNIINGGKHADSGLDIQEFMIVPVGAHSFPEAMRMGAEVYQHLKKLLASRGQVTAVGDEGGFAPKFSSNAQAVEAILEAIEKAGHSGAVKLALDAAASEFYKDGVYRFDKKSLSSGKLTEVYASWLSKYPFLSLEDPLAEDDWDGWSQLTASIGSRARIIGDDIFVTNLERLERGICERAANAILIKLNQIGTVTETVGAVLRAHESGFSTVISHRSGETEDAYIADLAVALNTGAIKTGAPCRSERLAKYNQLLRIHGELGRKAVYAKDRAFKPARVTCACCCA
ncbi:MAG TPA: phosphopyruvate hydratase [Elusimicrobia bacterium]|nr:phosphopyruvate hydratase [Elusimicrobiota bacterium]